MKLFFILAAALLIGSCSAQVVAPGVDVQVGAPVEYYYWGGHYHYWHENHYVVVDRVPEGHHWVTVDREPEHPLRMREKEERGAHRDFNERDEPIR